jgi:uncharacterized protein with GYD domain
MLEGRDLRSLPLLERKRLLARIMPRVECRLLYLDHVRERGSDLFRVACDRDLEGIVGKWAAGIYRIDQRSTSWLKIKNLEYSQMRDRHELFDQRGARPTGSRPRSAKPALVRRNHAGAITSTPGPRIQSRSARDVAFKCWSGPAWPTAARRESNMAKFLIQGSYTAEGAKGLIKEGGTGRKAAIQKALEGLGGTLDSIYYTFGADDVVVICEMPDTISGLALSLAVNASGAVRISTTPLLSVEDVDAACKKTVSYRPAGS